jgi:hypothetical protein
LDLRFFYIPAKKQKQAADKESSDELTQQNDSEDSDDTLEALQKGGAKSIQN